MAPLKLVLFDALHTLITPRLPIHVQYAQVMEPFLGALEPGLVKRAFKTSLKELQREKPVYTGGKDEWWGEVISRTAIGAGADPKTVRSSLGAMVPQLLERFSGKQGYKPFDDALPTLRDLRKAGLRTGLVSNADLRIKNVLLDLGLTEYLDPLLVSEEEGIQKPGKEIWERACAKAGVDVNEALYVGDELECDYFGAKRAGLVALLLRRKGEDYPNEDLTSVETIPSLTALHSWISERSRPVI